jgi:glycosyltransferase involved in cell wall biosynthesis
VGERIKQALTVCQLLPALDGGGVEQGTLEIAAALVHADQRSLVISAGGRLLSELVSGGSEHFSWPIGRKSPFTLRLVTRLRRLLLTEGVDILHARSRMPAWIAWLAWRGMDPATRPRFVTTVHGLYSVKAYSAIMMRGERIIAVSGHVRDYVLQHYPGVDAGRIVVIPRGVDVDRYHRSYRPDDVWMTAWRQQYSVLEDRYVVTLPGRVSRRKGVLDLIRIITDLQARGVAAHGLIVGELPNRSYRLAEELQAAIAVAGLAGSITQTGFRDDVREIMSVSSVVLSLSQHPEAFGRTVNEALALGVPVAGYAHGGVEEQLIKHFPAGLVPPGDVDAMAERLFAWSATSPSMQGVQVHALQDMLDSTLALYREMGGSGRNASRHTPVFPGLSK